MASFVQSDNYARNNGGSSKSTALAGTYGNNPAGNSISNYIPGGAPSYIQKTASGKVTDTRNFSTASVPKTTTSSSSGGGGGGVVYVGDGGGGGGGGGYENSILDQIKSLLKEQQEASKKYYETMYNQRMNEINTEADNNRNLINKNYKRGERYLNSMYGNTDSGTNWTNRARNNQNWLSQLAQNRENASGLRDSAAAQRDLGLSNAANTLAQGWYNYVMPVMTNRQNYSDSLAYRNYLANL